MQVLHQRTEAGRSLVSSCRKPTHEVCSRSRTVSGCIPSGGARPSVKPSPSPAGDAFSSFLGRSLSKIPKCSFSTSPSGQYVIP